MTTARYEILIFEDDIDLVMQWKRAFKEKHINISHATSVDSAMRLCTHQRFDAIICDLFIDEKETTENEGGIILLHRLQESLSSKIAILNLNSSIPRIVVSGCSSIVAHTLKKLTERLGSELFILKPFTPEHLVNTVIRTIEKGPND